MVGLVAGAVSARDFMNAGLIPASANTARHCDWAELDVGSDRNSCVREQLSPILENAKRSDLTSSEIWTPCSRAN